MISNAHDHGGQNYVAVGRRKKGILSVKYRCSRNLLGEEDDLTCCGNPIKNEREFQIS
jgi:hypothetical protein